MTPTAPIRLALVDDHAIVEVAFRAALADVAAVEFVGFAPTVHDLLEDGIDAELVVLDLRLADGSSPISNVSALRERGMRVIAYTAGEDPSLVRLVARTDVLGIVRKSAPVDVLLDTIRSAVDGHAVMSTEWAAAIDSDPGLADIQLTPQEESVLTLFATGLQTPAVAAALGIGAAVVDDHVRQIRSKYVDRAASGKVDLYQRAIDDGLFPQSGRE